MASRPDPLFSKQLLCPPIDRLSKPGPLFGELVKLLQSSLSIENLPGYQCFEHDG
jgi:hypothetical protein